MNQVELSASVRDLKISPSRLRAEGKLPGVIYGKGRAAVPLWVSERDIQRILSKHGRNVLMKLDIAGLEQDSTQHAIIKEVQGDTVSRKLLHIDFQRVALDETIRTRVPVVIKGENSVEAAGGIVQYLLRDVEVECLPQAVPSELVLDVSALKPGDSLTVGDIPLPEGVKVLEKPTEAVLTVVTPKTEEAVPAEAAEGPAEPEVVAKGKAKEEEEEGQE
ncbi:MAG TPA: 50S ribosomal protein L25 [Firmicutes bacterium]|nr:50S ribosomal protein L25 [Bacillota bacterium]